MARSNGRVPDEPELASQAPSGTRITVSLIAKVATDLRKIIDRTGLSQTDIVNRALTLYEFVDSEIAAGSELIIRRDGHEHLVKLL